MKKKEKEAIEQIIATKANAPAAKKEVAKGKEQGKLLNANDPAPKQLTWALYLANREASKLDTSVQVYGKQTGTLPFNQMNLTVGEAETMLAKYNAITGRAYKGATSTQPAVRTSKGKAKKETIAQTITRENSEVGISVADVQAMIEASQAATIAAIKAALAK
jgi:hypothetical protein